MRKEGLNPTHFVVSDDKKWEYQGPASETATRILQSLRKRRGMEPSFHAEFPPSSRPYTEQTNWPDKYLEFWYVAGRINFRSNGSLLAKNIEERIEDLRTQAFERGKQRFLACRDCDAPSVVVFVTSTSIPDCPFCRDHVPADFKRVDGSPDMEKNFPDLQGNGGTHLEPVETYDPNYPEIALWTGLTFLEYAEFGTEDAYDQWACVYYGDTPLTRRIVKQYLENQNALVRRDGVELAELAQIDLSQLQAQKT